MTIDELRANFVEAVEALEGRFAVVELRVFGSVARGDAGPDSDIDLLVTFSRTPNLQDWLELADYLSDRPRRSVDLIEPSAAEQALQTLRPSTSSQLLQRRAGGKGPNDP